MERDGDEGEYMDFDTYIEHYTTCAKPKLSKKDAEAKWFKQLDDMSQKRCEDPDLGVMLGVVTKKKFFTFKETGTRNEVIYGNKKRKATQANIADAVGDFEVDDAPSTQARATSSCAHLQTTVMMCVYLYVCGFAGCQHSLECITCVQDNMAYLR